MRVHPHRRTAIGLLATATLLTGALAPAAASALSRAHSASGCNPVLFLGARGSGEYGPGSANWPKGRKADDKYGFGPEVNEVYRKVSAGLSANLEAHSVDYGADRVTTLFHDYPKYFRDLQAGETWVMDKLTSRASACPRQLIVLAGYSQGAMVMHRVVRALARTRADAAIAGRIAAVVLVGDGDQVPHDNVTRFGTAGAGAHGIGLALRTISHSSAAKLSPGIGSRVLEVCDKHDIVCGWTDLDLVCLDIGIPTLICAHGVYVHLHYPGSTPLANAAAQAAADLRARLAGGGTWGTAIEVPGTAALNAGGNATMASVSCASPGNCAAGGTYIDADAYQQAFVVSQVNGTWRTAVEIHGTALNGQAAGVNSVSCASPGNCSAGGSYGDNYYSDEAFVVSEVNGTWGTAVEVPGTPALNTGTAYVASVSCASAGNCSAGGEYTDASGHQQAFVVSQVNGTWRTAVEAPGTAALNTGGTAYVNSVSCGAAGNCSAGGYYSETNGDQQAFVVSQVNGTWRTAIAVPGAAALNDGVGGGVASVSCASAGNCSAGGEYTDASGDGQVFVDSEG